MTNTVPFTSREVRWFFDGSLDEQPRLRRWFGTDIPLPEPELHVYLVIPGRYDLGIKWRDGLLQIKGRVAAEGAREFRSNHRGEVERWIKWSCSDMPEAYKALFSSAQGLVTITVRKRRLLRMMDLDSQNEVRAGVVVDRGLGFEITDLEIKGQRYCTLGIEAFPDERVSDQEFVKTVDRVLEGLSGIELDEARSMSYPAWLAQSAVASRFNKAGTSLGL